MQPHLERLFSDQKMIVFDEKRQYALVYNLHHSIMIPFTQEDAQHLLQNCHDNCIELFRRYFHTITTSQRSNAKLQAGYMPHRYRKYMPETQPEDN